MQIKLGTKVELLENVVFTSFIIIIIIDFGPSWSIQSSLVHLGLVWTNSVPFGPFLSISVHLSNNGKIQVYDGIIYSKFEFIKKNIDDKK